MNIENTETMNLEEIRAMKKQLADLQSKVAAQERALTKKPSNNNKLWELAGVPLITGVEIDDNGTSKADPPIPRYKSSPYSDMRTALLALARGIHEDPPVFAEREDTYYLNYWDNETRSSRPPLIRDLSDEQLQQSAELIGTIIPLVNAAYIKNHKTARLISKHGEIGDIPIQDPEQKGANNS